MEPWLLAVIFKPLAALGIITFCAYIRWLINRHMREGKFKTFLLKHRWGKKDSLSR